MHVYASIGAALDSLRRSVIESAQRNRLIGRGRIHPAVRRVSVELRQLREMIRSACSLDGGTVPEDLESGSAGKPSLDHAAGDVHSSLPSHGASGTSNTISNPTSNREDSERPQSKRRRVDEASAAISTQSRADGASNGTAPAPSIAAPVQPAPPPAG